MLSILGNLRINSVTRLERLKRSLDSMYPECDDWVINVRGTYRDEAIAFLKQRLGSRLNLFELLDDSRGWITNSLDMLEKAKHPYVLIWLEDHVNVSPQGTLAALIKEMDALKVDHLVYSWFLGGRTRTMFDAFAKEIEFKRGTYISHLWLTKEKWHLLRKNGYPYFLISMCGIYRKEFLKEMWHADQHRLPIWLKKPVFKFAVLLTKLGLLHIKTKDFFDKANRRLFFNKIRKYPRVTPFEMEKNPERVDVLPFRLAFPNSELLACVDDDLDTPGSSLMSRGLYTPSPREKADAANA